MDTTATALMLVDAYDRHADDGAARQETIMDDKARGEYGRLRPHVENVAARLAGLDIEGQPYDLAAIAAMPCDEQSGWLWDNVLRGEMVWLELHPDGRYYVAASMSDGYPVESPVPEAQNTPA